MNWEDKSIGELFSVGSSKRVLKSQWQTKGVPFYRGREVTKLAIHGHVDNELFISGEHFSDLAKKHGVPKPEDIVITAIGTIGNSYIVKPGDRFYFKDASVLWLAKRSDVDSFFVNYWLQSPQFKKQLDKGNGATVDTLTISKLRVVRIGLPPLPEQKRIVAILDEAFAGIATAVANTEKNLANARELFECYLDSMFEIRGDGWVERSLADICGIESSLVDPRGPEFADLPHVGAGNMVSKSGALVDVRTACEEGLKSGKFLFDGSMVLYSKIRHYLEKVARPDFSGLCSADIYPLKPKTECLNRDFLYYLLLSKSFTDYAISGSARAGMPKVNRQHLFRYIAAIPAIADQKKIVDSLDDVASKSRYLEAIYQRKLTALAELKQSLLQKAFSGELTAGKEARNANLREEEVA